MRAKVAQLSRSGVRRKENLRDFRLFLTIFQPNRPCFRPQALPPGPPESDARAARGCKTRKGAPTNLYITAGLSYPIRHSFSRKPPPLSRKSAAASGKKCLRFCGKALHLFGRGATSFRTGRQPFPAAAPRLKPATAAPRDPAQRAFAARPCRRRRKGADTENEETESFRRFSFFVYMVPI